MANTSYGKLSANAQYLEQLNIPGKISFSISPDANCSVGIL